MNFPKKSQAGLNSIQPPKDGLLKSIKKWFEVKSLEVRYGLVSVSMRSNGLACYIASARPKGNAVPASEIESGMVGKNDLSARLAALKLWVRKHGRRNKPVFRLDAKRFNSPSGIRLWCWVMFLRLALLAGHPVVLIGACRTGKTLLLNKLTPGKIIDKREEAMHGMYGMHLTISNADVPAGIYSLDECQLIEPLSISQLIVDMATSRRTFCLAAQRYGFVKDAVDVYRSYENSKRVFLVVVGGQSNPSAILRELQ